MGFLKQLRDATGREPPTKPFLTAIREIAKKMAAENADPWAAILANLKGHVVGGIERISTKDVFEKLGNPPRAQSSDIRRRLARRMVELGWSSIRAHGLNPRGFLTRVRGFARPADHEGEPLQPPSNRPGRRPQPLM